MRSLLSEAECKKITRLILQTLSSASYLQHGRWCLCLFLFFSGLHVSQAVSWPWHSPVYCSLSPCLIHYLINMLIVRAGSMRDQHFISWGQKREIRGSLSFFILLVSLWVCVYNKVRINDAQKERVSGLRCADSVSRRQAHTQGDLSWYGEESNHLFPDQCFPLLRGEYKCFS